MKISGIHIHNFYQFQDLKLNLTYPEGHQKAGQPLDKVCLIGQSGTGKTTLLELLRTVIQMIDNPYLKDTERIELEENQRITVTISRGKNTIDLSWPKNTEQDPLIKDAKFKRLISLLLEFPVGISNSYPRASRNNSKYISMTELKNRSKDKFEYFNFDSSVLENIWTLASYDATQYYLDEADYRVHLTRQAQKGEINPSALPELIDNWKAKHTNPLEQIANECLNPLLNRFYLAVKTEVDNYRQAEFLQVYSTQNGQTIPYHRLSTGTRQIIYTAFPIYQLLEPNAIVLMDEPENSLYPDIQQEIISYYTSFDQDKQSQFFFATHSPIIASAFEPWEVVELKFDKKGEVFRELYYEGENHIKNYHTDPRYLRWDSILTKVFDLEAEGNEPERSNMLTEFAVLKRKIKKLEKEGKLHTEKELLAEFERVGALLDWETAKN